MNKKELQQQQVKSFFDNIAKEYRKKYVNKDSFLYYFFQQRIFESTDSFSFEGKSILDIGAGTGEIFHLLTRQSKSFEYFATDISSKMLEESGIPKQQYFVGDIIDFPLKGKKYDYIFLLGVTTYFSLEVLEQHLDYIQKSLAKNGVAVLSFTNRNSIDFKIRQPFRFLTRALKFEKNVMGQPFDIFAYSPIEATNKTENQFSIQKRIFLNQTFPPFYFFFPKTSIRLAKFLKKYISSPTLLSWLSSDFLIFLEKK